MRQQFKSLIPPLRRLVDKVLQQLTHHLCAAGRLLRHCEVRHDADVIGGLEVDDQNQGDFVQVPLADSLQRAGRMLRDMRDPRVCLEEVDTE